MQVLLSSWDRTTLRLLRRVVTGPRVGNGEPPAAAGRVHWGGAVRELDSPGLLAERVRPKSGHCVLAQYECPHPAADHGWGWWW